MFSVTVYTPNDYDKIPEQVRRDEGITKEWMERDYRSILVINKNGSYEVHMDKGEPEDHLFCRNLSWVAPAIKEAYELGLHEGTEIGFHDGQASVIHDENPSALTNLDNETEYSRGYSDGYDEGFADGQMTDGHLDYIERVEDGFVSELEEDDRYFVFDEEYP